MDASSLVLLCIRNTTHTLWDVTVTVSNVASCVLNKALRNMLLKAFGSDAVWLLYGLCDKWVSSHHFLQWIRYMQSQCSISEHSHYKLCGTLSWKIHILFYSQRSTLHTRKSVEVPLSPKFSHFFGYRLKKRELSLIDVLQSVNSICYAVLFFSPPSLPYSIFSFITSPPSHISFHFSLFLLFNIPHPSLILSKLSQILTFPLLSHPVLYR